MAEPKEPPSLLDQAKALPDAPGVYVMKDEAGVEIYVGKAKSLRKRVSSYFRKKDRAGKDRALVEAIVAFEYVETDSELEAFLLENRMIKDLRPKYNAMLKDNERYPFIEVTLGEDYPQVRSVFRQSDPKSRYFGPFVAAGDVKACLNLLQRIFKFRPCSRAIEADKPPPTGRSCLNAHIGLCPGVCRHRISKEEYRSRIHGLCRFLSGQKKGLIEDLRKEMEEAAKQLHFEKAAALRDLVGSLETVNAHSLPDASLAPAPPPVDPARGLENLREVLGLDARPRRVEGLDIANLQGKETVGAVVSFVDGLPLKDGYRRFRIKTVDGQDDFACIAEVVRRRYGRLVREGRDLPDIILIDGGKGQLHAAEEALREVGAHVPALLSLAKAEETPYQSGREDPLPLTKRHAGLKLLMFVRDEAHRFAQHYHHILRRKAVFND